VSKSTLSNDESHSDNQSDFEKVENPRFGRKLGSTIETLVSFQQVLNSTLVALLRLHKTLLLLGYIYANQFIMKLATNKLHSHTG
jgi:hypothetical protein